MLKYCWIVIVLLFAGCHRVPDQVDPKITYAVPDRYLKSLPSPFPPLSPLEKMEDFGKEYWIGITFAKNLDLYQAITAFKRAEILLGTSNENRLLEIQYEILLCYYVGQKYKDVTDTFEHSGLKTVGPSFPAFHDLLIILQNSYLETGNTSQAERLRKVLESYDKESGEKLELSTALLEADFPTIRKFAAEPPYATYLKPFLASYNQDKKSVGKAQGFNALIPGAGYLYLGQKQSAITAFLLNSLFIGASAYFFHDGNLAAGIIFTSFEAGWYFGGIYGAGLEAKYYNERLYERKAQVLMQQERLFPILMLRYAF